MRNSIARVGNSIARLLQWKWNLIARLGNSIARLLRRQPSLPEDVISKIMSFTTPPDVCRLACVSRQFRSAANSNSVWDKWIPPQCVQQILPRAVSPIAFSSKKELYLRLSDSILIDQGRKIFWLERSTAKIGYMLSARELDFAWRYHKRFWRWGSRNDSRFSDLMKIKAVSWLNIRGGIDCRLLSASTEYRVVFVLKFGKHPYGWTEGPIKFSVTIPYEGVIERTRLLAESSEPTVFRYEDGDDYDDLGWLQLVVGKFTVREDGDYDDSSAHIEFCMQDIDSAHWKCGLLLDGVRIEPRTGLKGFFMHSFFGKCLTRMYMIFQTVFNFLRQNNDPTTLMNL